MMAASAHASYVRDALVAPKPPPVIMGGRIGALLGSLVASPFNFVLTILSAALVVLVLLPLIRFLMIDAVWEGDREACLKASGACWPFVKAKFGQFIYGFYPAAERWRPNLVFGIGALLLAPLLIPAAPLKRLNALLFLGIYPIVALVLLTGGDMDFQRFILGRIIAVEQIAGISVRSGLRSAFWLDYAVSTLAVTALVAAGAKFLGARAGSAARVVISVFFVLGLVLLALDFDFGLTPVETQRWGGLMVTLVVAITGIVASLPLGVLLALGRRSELPVVRIASVVFIEFWRGVPLITVLFFATYMLPLFLPQGVSVDALLRVLIGVALFSAAYMAEVVRGGLQAVPRGQYEGAIALGLSHWRAMRLVVLPQALNHVIPGIVNNFIGLFKDTTLVLIVAIFDLLGQLRSSFADPNWATPTTLFTGFAFTGMIYFVFCFGMSRYALFLERRAAEGQRR
jgi:general L-amino acid transport system permease protein